MKELIILAHVITDSVNAGFIPAAQRLGLSIVLLTDHAEAHRQYFNQMGLPAYPNEIVACDVFNPLAVIETITCRAETPVAIFSNSDHLQTSTAIVADYFGLPRKNWHVTYRAKNKAEMRADLKTRGLDMLWFAVVCDKTALAQVLDGVPFPCIVKPREGVASQQVSLSYSRAELEAQCAAVWSTLPEQPLLLEEYIEGPLYTLETIGDDKKVCVLGGFKVKLSPPPHFVELEASWGTGLTNAQETQVVDIIRCFGVGFGACHTEFVMTDKGPRLIEINYRNIGDYREFLMQDTLDIPLFEIVLRLYMGEPLPHLNIAPDAGLIRYFTAHSAGRLANAPEAFVRYADDIQVTYKPLRMIGDIIHLTNSNKDYLGVLRGAGSDAQCLGLEMDRITNGLAWKIDA
ncbi:MAG: ATP-grasp domain-containing protein [Candidatus Nitrotoga sp.]|nr:ATP-grasp domain-containing protein [Candidatus Nitrotoga sp.]